MTELYQIDDKSTEPLRLAYVYLGSCPECNSEVETLEQTINLDGKERFYVLAYCLRCRKQLKTQEAKRLE